ncbi:16S rRNA (cytosine(1402)-N(4))-methyltransferase RsmH [Tomitella biformata]|uniref:16S rRNA (cytosine(1402)-N(4))-methyltransferase RsmH n=1 Tax=Tomitella biformata TaxID=630403 RepID=UPI000467A094|nr:16S rRNA (cytosine(1402)-N(4))-methyltransferase RsmH [Tomitella biformata]
MVDGAGDAKPRSGEFGHVPVMLHRAEELLGPSITAKSPDGAGAVMVDGTLGMGGHSEHFLRTFPGLRLIGLDRDTQALGIAGSRLEQFGDRITLVHTRYDGIAEALESAGVDPRGGVDAILFDLGVSSLQLDETQRGFAYSVDAPLDMRMDPTQGPTAADVLNTYSKSDLTRILRVYGEERFASRIAGEVVRRRVNTPFTTTAELVEVLYTAIPAATRRTGGHPGKRTFQALRVEVNGELDSLEAAVPAALEALGIGGRVAFMSYQSLEDRVVKHALAERVKSLSPQDLPMELPGMGPEFRLITRGAEKATEEEIESNPRSAPVRLRCAQRIAWR